MANKIYVYQTKSKDRIGCAHYSIRTTDKYPSKKALRDAFKGYKTITWIMTEDEFNDMNK